MKTILVVENDSWTRKLIQDTLTDYTLLEATTAEQALRRFADHNRQISILVSAVALPKSSGILVSLLLRSELPALPIILTSADPIGGWTLEDLTDYARLGPESVTVLQKPFQFQVLSEAVHQLIGAPGPKARRAG